MRSTLANGRRVADDAGLVVRALEHERWSGDGR
jgi:hypothetical protein